jgi:hypothetical protein
MKAWLTSLLSCFTLRERVPRTHWIGQLVGWSGKLLLSLDRADSVSSECRGTHDDDSGNPTTSQFDRRPGGTHIWSGRFEEDKTYF